MKFTGLGIAGVFLGTTACFLVGRIWMDARTLYRNWFNVKFERYIKKYIANALLTLTTAAILKQIINCYFYYCGITVITWIIAAVIIVMILTISFIALFRKKEEFIYFKNLIFSLLREFKKYI